MCFQKKKILIVDDQAAFRDLFCDLLKGENFFCIAAGSFWEARNVLLRQDFDLVILDWHLEFERTGFELLPFIENSSKIILTSIEEDNYSLKKMINNYKIIDDFYYKLEVLAVLEHKVEKLFGF